MKLHELNPGDVIKKGKREVVFLGVYGSYVRYQVRTVTISEGDDHFENWLKNAKKISRNEPTQMEMTFK